jgi:hypothetical protein
MILETLSQKKDLKKRAGSNGKSKCEALSSNPSALPSKKKKKTFFPFVLSY